MINRHEPSNPLPMPALPGWYPDPSGIARYRCWDGRHWTHRAFGAPPGDGDRRSLEDCPPPQRADRMSKTRVASAWAAEHRKPLLIGGAATATAGAVALITKGDRRNPDFEVEYANNTLQNVDDGARAAGLVDVASPVHELQKGFRRLRHRRGKYQPPRPAQTRVVKESEPLLRPSGTIGATRLG